MYPEYILPTLGEDAFNCPHCNAYSNQVWFAGFTGIPIALANRKLDDTISLFSNIRKFVAHRRVANLHFSQCARCNEITVWFGSRLSYPLRGQAPPPNPSLPKDIIKVYNEAGSILDQSPRGAAALLRLAVQMLCMHLGQPGENINTDIKELVKNGLDQRLQQAFDMVRVTGNNAVHPGTMNIDEDRKTVERLFDLINMIAEDLISKPKRTKDLYEKMPKKDRDAIDKRDRKQKAKTKTLTAETKVREAASKTK